MRFTNTILDKKPKMVIVTVLTYSFSAFEKKRLNHECLKDYM